MKLCLHCQTDQSDTAKFCNDCGQAFADAIAPVAPVAPAIQPNAEQPRPVWALVKTGALVIAAMWLGLIVISSLSGSATETTASAKPMPSPTPAPFAYRDEAVTAYRNLVQNIYSNYNGIEVKLAKVKGGFALYAYHEFFNEYEFSAGDDAKLIQAWAGMHGTDLSKFQIVRVGVMGRGAYSSGTWYDLK